MAWRRKAVKQPSLRQLGRSDKVDDVHEHPPVKVGGVVEHPPVIVTGSNPKGFSLPRNFRLSDEALVSPPPANTTPVKEAVQAMSAALEHDSFMLCTKFLVAVFHNVLAYPDKRMYRKMRTTSTIVQKALRSPSVARLLDLVGFSIGNGEQYELSMGASLQVLQEAEDAMVEERKKQGVLEAWELFPTDIVRSTRLGAGEFGEVHQGKWLHTNVAIKLLKPEATPQACKDFLHEANIMKDLRHKNVMGLCGVVLSKKPYMIVLDLMVGDLKSHLRSVDLGNSDKLRLALEVAAGLEYLHFKDIVHCDLAARNVLMSEKGQCVISDFGLARKHGTPDCDTSNRVFPISVRWSAPEVWTTRIVSKETDVWSYGVLFYEIMTSGATPYVKWRNARVRDEVAAGFRLRCPIDCPDDFHSIMALCWATDPAERPSAPKIVEKLMGLKISMSFENRPRRSLSHITLTPATSTHKLGSGILPLLRGRRKTQTADNMGPFSLFMQMAEQGDDFTGLAGESSADDEVPKPKATLQLPGQNKHWVQGQVSSKRVTERVEPILMSCKRGDFCVHETRVAGEFVLSLRWEVPLHILVQPVSGKYTLDEKKFFPTIDQLVTHYQSSKESFEYFGRQIILQDAIQLPQAAESRQAGSSKLDPTESDTDSPVAEQDQGEHFDIFVCYQAETDGEVARRLYDALEETQTADGRPLVCFLDQYDLNPGSGENAWTKALQAALNRSTVLAVLVSEPGLEVLPSLPEWETILGPCGQALEMLGKGKLAIVPILVGQYLELKHPRKPGKTFTVYEEFDGFSVDQLSNEPPAEGSRSQRDVLRELFKLDSVFVDPKQQDVTTVATKLGKAVDTFNANRSTQQEAQAKSNRQAAFAASRFQQWSVDYKPTEEAQEDEARL